MNGIKIRRVETHEQPAMVRLLMELNPGVSANTLSDRLERMLRDHSHYSLYAAYDGETPVGVCGAWVGTRVWCGRYLEIDNLVVDPAWRSQGVGSQLIDHLSELARQLSCEVVVLDSYTANHASHRLYHRLGFEILGFHFIKSLAGGVDHGTAA